ncbi:universal stress protein [Subtercola lobariae]|uniref:UspA domain-containing protein n=1 Tax=Subtercola lobariae TaxID=1588641 RepID=A0A917EZS6_9MICO|nr:universal stress protein [Subtercola lobariae]GGF30340.1 hypothetical protein GCM10011399_24400 [Subtercola lobariae]
MVDTPGGVSGGGGFGADGGAGGAGEPRGTAHARIVVGVFPGQPDTVLSQAAVFALRFDATLVCAFVDQTRYVVARNSDATVISASIDPDIPDDISAVFPPELGRRIAAALDPLDVRWLTLSSAGDPADSLGSLAEAMDAAAIVVGTHRSTARSSIAEFFNGSVAVHLAHRQHRPVIVVPVAPVERGQALPWPNE